MSEVFAKPEYQKNVSVPSSLNNKTKSKSGRGLSDISGNADSISGYITRVDGQDTVVGGTSDMAPLLAGLVALLNQALGKPVGFLNPKLYQLKSSSTTLRDITEGNNKVNTAPGYTSQIGWDACTGLGSPNGTQLLAALKALQKMK